jgi:hypothetical protein
MTFIYSHLKSPAMWSMVVLVLSGVFSTLTAQYPGVPWIGAVVGILSFISANYFKKQEILQAATNSLKLGVVSSGQ